MFSDPQSSLLWHPNVVPTNMESLIHTSGWLKTFFVVMALFWVAYRGYQVLSKPVEELVGLLGLEVPVAPIVSLAGIKADGVLLHWKPPEQRSSVLKYLIRINGIDVGDVSPQETSATIENLLPNHHYVIRVVTLNSANFQAPSVPLRLKTLSASSEQFYNTAPNKDQQDGEDDKDYNPAPIIRPCKMLVETVPPPTPAPAMAREHSNSTSRARRMEPGRRNSPASQTGDQAQEAADTSGNIKQLTERLDGLRRDNDEVEKQTAEEEEEFQANKAALVEKRDEKKQALKEKEDASRELRKEVANLERSNTSAQTRKTQQERLLRQKESERKKMKDDVARWQREIEEMKANAERIEKEQHENESLSDAKIQELRNKHAEELQVNKSLEELIREKGTQIKALEEEKKRLAEGEDGAENQEGTDAAAVEEDRNWMVTLQGLQQRYAQAWSLLCEAERGNREASARLAYLQQRRMSQPQIFGGIMPQEGVPTRRNSRSMRPHSMRETVTSTAPGGFVHSTAPPFNTGMSGVSPSFPSATPYFNMNNGMTLPDPSRAMSTFSQADIESLTGGAPMSPTAGALLPSDLFGNDAEKTDTEEETGPKPMPTLDPSPRLGGALPGLGAPQTMDHIQSPSSPVSIQSRSPSVFASPRESSSHLPNFSAADNLVDSDRRSIRSTSSSLMQRLNEAPNSRFGSLFGLHRQRGKTLSGDGLPLGSLKGSQSQSLPKKDPAEQDPIGTQRRRGSGGAWYEAFTRSSKTAPIETSSPQHVATRKRPFNMFGSKGDPWLTAALGERPSSSRQGSTQSGDAILLPRPSTEMTRFGWPVDGFGSRNSPLAADWSVGNTNSWSRHPSRRPSLTYGSSSNLLNDGLVLDDSDDFPSTTRSPTQAPIGTRPQSSASQIQHSAIVPPTPPRMLNPAAPNFKSIFIRGEKKTDEEKAEEKAKKAAEKEAKKVEKLSEKKAKSAEKSEKAARKAREKNLAVEIAAYDSGRDLSSPMDFPRRSRDDYSISTAEDSSASRRESFDHVTSNTSAETPSVGKETFMQKLSRKSSSGQFFPGFGKGKASLFSKKASEVGTPDETDEDPGSALLARSVESVAGSPSLGTPKDKSSALSWSSIKKMGRRGDKTPSLHESITSEATEDEADEVGNETLLVAA